MDAREHFRITGGALKNWFIAQAQDALAVAALWLVGLVILQIPLWYVWAPLAFLFQFIPHFGPVLTLVGPAVSALIQGGFEKLLFVLILYAVVVVVDGFLLQPFIMRRTARVPIWASLMLPLVIIFTPLGFWGVLLAPPLLAVFYAYWHRRKADKVKADNPRTGMPVP